MSKIDSIEPVVVSETCWLYGEREGLTVVQEDRDAAGVLRATLIATIPWEKVGRARGRRPMSAPLSPVTPEEK